jgi:hypothetical protein
MDERLESVFAERLEKKHLRFSARLPGAQESRAQHSRRVHGDRVAWRKELDDVGEPTVVDRPARSLDHHEPALVSALSRRLCDPIGGKSEVVIRGTRAGARGLEGRNHVA